MRKRLERIEIEMLDFNRVMREFTNAADREISSFVGNMAKLQKNLNLVKTQKNSITPDGNEEIGKKKRQ